MDIIANIGLVSFGLNKHYLPGKKRITGLNIIVSRNFPVEFTKFPGE
jgi:hypothetical protein